MDFSQFFHEKTFFPIWLLQEILAHGQMTSYHKEVRNSFHLGMARA